MLQFLYKYSGYIWFSFIIRWYRDKCAVRLQATKVIWNRVCKCKYTFCLFKRTPWGTSNIDISISITKNIYTGAKFTYKHLAFHTEDEMPGSSESMNLLKSQNELRLPSGIDADMKTGTRDNKRFAFWCLFAFRPNRAAVLSWSLSQISRLAPHP